MRNSPGTVSILLVYEPVGVGQRPIPIARTGHVALTEAAARAIITEAEERADSLGTVDAELFTIERDEAQRIRALLLKLIPALVLEHLARGPSVQ